MALKQCSDCKEHKLPDFFSKQASRCKPCAVNHSKAWALRNPGKVKATRASYRSKYSSSKINGHRLKYRYGITLEQHAAMIQAQGSKCAICASEFVGTPHVDHCHATGKVRGMLCDRCNRGLGYFRDSPDALDQAAAYVRGHRA